MATIGPMARSVADVSLVLRVIAGGDGTDPFVGPAPPFTDPVEPGSLRVGFYDEDGAWPATDETKAAVKRAAELLAERGAYVEEVAPPPVGDATELFFAMMAADGGARARADLARLEGNTCPG